jgi:hypothetical protein
MQTKTYFFWLNTQIIGPRSEGNITRYFKKTVRMSTRCLCTLRYIPSRGAVTLKNVK